MYEAVGAPGDSSGSAAGSTSSVSAGAPLSPSGTASNDDKPPGPSSLKGKVVVIDPGHNVTNFQHTAEINRKVNIGTNWKECDTTGTSTNAGYAEAQFTMDVSHRLKALLERQGVTVKLTHDGDPRLGAVRGPAGPDRERRARGRRDLHPRGRRTGRRPRLPCDPAGLRARGLRRHPRHRRPLRHPRPGHRGGDYRRATGEQFSNYIGEGTGLVTRKDLGGLNLSTVPKVFIECGNMRDSKDAALLTNSAWRQKAAQGISEGIVSFLRG